MSKYGLFSTKGDRIPNSAGELSGGSYKDVANIIHEKEAAFYLSYKNGKTLVGTIFKTHDTTRVHDTVYLEERDWVLNPNPFGVIEVREFFKQAAGRVETCGYVVDDIASNLFKHYLDEYYLKPGNRQDTRLSQEVETCRMSNCDVKDISVPIVNLTLGRLYYGQQVVAKANNPDIAIAYVCAVTEALRDYLKYGYSFAISLSKIDGLDVQVSISEGMVSSQIDLESMELTGNVASLPYFENAVKVLKTTSKKDLISAKITRETMPGWFIRQTLNSRGIMPKPEREKYRDFLNAESIQYDSKIFDDIDRAEEERERKRKAEEEARERRRKEEEERKAKAAAAKKAVEKKTEEIPAEPVKGHKFISPFGRKDKQKEDNKTIDSKNVTSVSKKNADAASEPTTESKQSPFGRKTSAKTEPVVSKAPYNTVPTSTQKQTGKTRVPIPKVKNGKNTTSEIESKEVHNSPFVEQKEKSSNSEKREKKSSPSKNDVNVDTSRKNKGKRVESKKKKETKKEQDKKTEKKQRTKKEKGKEREASKKGKKILFISFIAIFIILIITLFVIALMLGGYIPALESVLEPIVGSISSIDLNNTTLPPSELTAGSNSTGN